MEQRMRVWLKGHSLVKSVHDKRIVIVIADLVSYDPAVIKIQDGAQVYLMNICADVILELSYISQPFLIRSIRVEIPVKVILRDVRRIITAFCAALRFPFDCRLDMFFPTNTYSFFSGMYGP